MTLLPDADDDDLRELSESDNKHMRTDVAATNRTPHDILEKLAKDSSGLVRRAVAYNKNTPKEVLEILCDDEFENIAKRASERIENGEYRTETVVSESEEIE